MLNANNVFLSVISVNWTYLARLKIDLCIMISRLLKTPGARVEFSTSFIFSSPSFFIFYSQFLLHWA